MRPCPPLFSSLPPTVRAILARSSSASAGTATVPSGATSAAPRPDSSSSSSSDRGTSPQQDGSPESVEAHGAVRIKGWVKSVRAHKNVSFAAISDGTTSDVLQAVFKGQNISEQITPGMSLSLRGELKASRGKGQAVELVVKECEVLGGCDPETYPIQKKHLPEHILREQAHLRFKTTLTAATMRVRDALMRDWHDWFEDNEFTHIHTPILTSSDCEGAGEVFRLQNPTNPIPSSASSSSSTSPPTTFFPQQVNLTVSSQLHLEAPTHSLSRTYTLSPAFRSERSMTSRHLAEFYMLEGEVVVETLDGLLDIVEDGIRSALRRIVSGDSARAGRIRRDLAAIAVAQIPEGEAGSTSAQSTSGVNEQLARAAERAFTRLTYTDAVGLLERHADAEGFNIRPEWGVGLSTEHEKFLARHFDGPVFVTHYPASLKPFYMLPSDAGGSATTSTQPAPTTPEPTVACFDLLVPGLGELIGGSLREHRLDHMLAAVKRAGLREEDYAWYLDLRRFGSVPHGGWGMGWERWISWVTGVGNVRDVVAFPRWFGHCKY